MNEAELLYAQPEEDNKLAADVLRKYYAAKKAREPYDRRWRTFYRFYRGKQWSTERPSYRPSLVANYIFSAIETILPLMTDSSPKIVVVSDREETAQAGTMMNTMVDYLWRKMNMQTSLPMWVKNSLIYGSGIAMNYWDTEGEDGVGEHAVKVISNFHFYPDPNATCIQDARYIITAIPTNIDGLKRKYSKKKVDMISPDTSLKGSLESQVSDMAESGRGNVAPGYGADDYKGGEVDVDKPKKDQTMLIECWWKDYTTTKVPDINPQEDAQMQQEMGHTMLEHYEMEGIKPPMKVVRKYPGGRVTVVAGGVLLSDKANPFRHGRFPFVKTDNYSMPGEFWGMGEVEQIIELQKEVNKRRSQIAEALNLTVNPIIFMDNNCGVDPDTIVNRPGLIIPINPGTSIVREPGPEIPSSVFKTIDDIKMDIDTITGVHDVTQGRKPAGVQAASAIAELQEAAQTRNRLKIRNLEQAIRDLGEILVENVKQFYKIPRIMPVMGDKTQQWIQFFPEQVNGTSFLTTVEAGSTLPVSRVAKAQDAKELFQMQAIDVPALLRHMDFPDGDEIAERVQQQQQEQQQAQQQQEQMKEQMEAQKVQMEIQKLQIEMQIAQQEAQVGQQVDQMKLQIEQQKLQLEQQKADQEMALEQQKMELEQQKMQMEMELERQKHETEMQFKQMQAASDIQMEQQKLVADTEMKKEANKVKATEKKAVKNNPS